jgi:uncharacterized membrane protein HdeD (DUF308 family)
MAIATASSYSSRSSIILAILLIVLGLLAIFLPTAASIGVARVLSWLLLFDGIFQLVYAFRSKGIGSTIWKFLVAVLYIGAGVYLLMHPLLGLVGLTLVLAVFFFVEGAMDIIGYVWTHKVPGSEWLLLHGVVTLLLGLMIWRRWPISSLWALGIIVGVSMFVTGVTRLLMALKNRQLAAVPR